MARHRIRQVIPFPNHVVSQIWDDIGLKYGASSNSPSHSIPKPPGPMITWTQFDPMASKIWEFLGTGMPYHRLYDTVFANHVCLTFSCKATLHSRPPRRVVFLERFRCILNEASVYYPCIHGPLTRYVKMECWGRFSRHRLQMKPLVSDPGMHHGTCVTHVSWCISWSLNPRWRGNIPGIPGACATRNFTYLARGPCSSPGHFLLQPLGYHRLHERQSLPHQDSFSWPWNRTRSIVDHHLKIKSIDTIKCRHMNALVSKITVTDVCSTTLGWQ